MDSSELEGLEPLGTSGDAEALANLLADTQVLGDLPWAEVVSLAKYMRAYRLPKDQSLFSEGDPGDYWCIILAGSVSIRKADSREAWKEVARLGKGKTLGEMAMLDGEHRSASCVARQDSVLAVMTREGFESLVEAYPRLAVSLSIRIARILSQRLRQTSGLLVDYLDTSD